MATRQEVIDALSDESLPISGVSRNNLKEAMMRGTMSPDDAMENISLVQAEARGESPAPPDKLAAIPSTSPTGDRRFVAAYNGELNEPVDLPDTKQHTAIVTLPNGRKAKVSGTREQIMAASEQLMAEMGDAQRVAEQKQNADLRQQAAIAQQSIATNEVGPDPVINPPLFTSPGMATIPTPGDDPARASNDPERLRLQAKRQGIDVESGFDDRFASGLAQFQDGQFQALLIDKHTRQRLKESGVSYPDNMPVVGIEENTGQIAFLRPITQDDVDKGDDPNNLGKTRWTLADPPKAEFGDVAEFLPNAPIIGAEIGAGAIAALSIKSPQAALAASSAASGVLNSMSVPLRKKILKEQYGFTDEEIAAHSDPNEALKQGAIAFGGELGFGQLIAGVRAFKNRRGGSKFLTEKDYDVFVESQQEVIDTYKALDDVVNMGIQPSNELIATAAGVSAASRPGVTSSAAEAAIRTEMARGRRSLSSARRAAARDLDIQLKVGAGYRELTNRAVLATDPDNLARLGKERGIAAPEELDPSQRALTVRDTLADDEGVTSARKNIELAYLDEDEALQIINRRSNSSNFTDSQKLLEEQVTEAGKDSQAAWSGVRNILETNGKGQAGIVLKNTASNSPIRRSLNQISREGQANLSQALGKKSSKFVEDLEALRGDTLDINSLHRLRSQLLREKRSLDSNPQNLGFDARDIQSVVDAIDTQLTNADWVRAGTGRSVPAVKKRGLDALGTARTATDYYKNIAQKSTIRDLTALQKKFKVNEKGVRVQDGYEFQNLPNTVRDKLLGDAEALRDVMNVVGQDPQVRSALSSELEALYRRNVYRNDQYKEGLAQEFRRQYGDQMDILFGPDEAAKISNVENFSRARIKMQDRAKRTEAIFEETFGGLFGEGARTAPDHLIKEAMQSSKISAGQLKNMIGRLDDIDPRLAQQLRAEQAQWLSAGIVKAGGQLRSGDAVRTVMVQNESKIRAVLGDQYFTDMKKVIKALDVLEQSKTVRRVADPAQTPVLQLTRTLFGALSNTQRRITAVNRFVRGRNAEKAIEMMADPEKLRKFIRLQALRSESLVAQAIIADLGLSTYLEDQTLSEREIPAARIRDFMEVASGLQ